MRPPYLDVHTVAIPASREAVWAGLQHYVAGMLSRVEGSPLVKVLGSEPRAGFEVSESTPPKRLGLAGRHRFARYLIEFELSEGPTGSTSLHARSYAAFPGIRGRVYRALVIGTRAHVLATNHMLRAVRRLALEPSRPTRRP